jgi:nucleolar pre-ribosomal-associated protein 1
LIDVLSVIPATLALLVRLLSHNDELKAYGSRIIEAVLKPDNMKHIYRGLTGSHDYVVSPCLRLLTEMNRFGFGELCGLVHSTFDFTIKQLPRHLEVKGSTKPGLETPEKPSLRTLWVRFLLSFMQHGEPSTRNDILRLRTYISHLFKHLKTDSPFIVRDLLDCMAKKVLAEKEIPKTTKTNVFNEWALGHILALYSRQEKVIVVGNGTEIEKTVSDLAHEFLLYACTTHGNGVCFPDNGWYPPGYSEGGGRRGSAPKVYNRVLSSFLSNTRPHADTQQLDLTLQIFKSCPELVADYFLSNQTFSFDPKLTSTWIGYCTFLMSIISLPIPSDFGTAKVPILLPPMDVMVENILPKPLSKTVITKWLAHENGLLRLFATRLSIAAFQKLREVLKALDVAASTIHNPTENLKCRFAVVEEFYKRIPDIAVVNNAISGKYGANVGVLESEGKMRLLANYYTTIPEMALATNFDINIALSGFLEGRNEDNDQKGMRLLEMGHLLKIAAEIPDVKWWNKSREFDRIFVFI